MNIFPEDCENRNNNHRKANNNKTGYLKAVISEHETSKNLQANDLAKEKNDNKIIIPPSSTASPATASTNSSISEGSLEATGAFVLPPPIRPIVVGGPGRGDYGDDDDDDDGTVTCSVNGLPSTEI